MTSIRVVLDYPWWFVLFCILTGVLYASVLYFRNRRVGEVPRAVRWTMATARFLAVSLLAFLLLSPLLKMITREVHKPVVIIAQDNSSSLIFNKDSSYYRNEYPSAMKAFAEELSDKFDVKTYSFGEEVKEGMNFSYRDKQTDISMLLSEIETRYTNRNLGAVVIATDGLYNKGQNPVFTFSGLRLPVFTVALGDTSIRKDILVSKVINNRLAYLGNKFPVEVVIDGKQCKGQSSNLTITKGNSVLFSKKIDFNSAAFNITVPLELEATETGVQRYKAKLTPVEGELTRINNEQDFFIDVLDAREKVLILCDAPHPDVAALRNTIRSNQNYEAESFTVSEFDKKLSDYSLVILHNLPSPANPVPGIIEKLNAAQMPVLYVVGMQTAYRGFNALNTPVDFFPAGSSKPDDAEVSVEKNFPLFTLSEELMNYASRFPALQVPFGEFRLNPNGSAAFYIQKGIVKTKQPMIAFSDEGERKTGVISGEGIWRWRLSDYADHGNQDIFNELINKTIQYLAVKVDKSMFRVASKNNFMENEQVEFQAELYNDSYELINEPEVSISVTGADNKKYNYAFSKTAKAYRLNAGVFPVGDYRYEANVKSGNRSFRETGVFSVYPLVVEASNTSADHQLLFSLASRHQGKMVYPSDLLSLAEELKKREDIKPVIYNPKKLVDFIHLEWIFFVLLFLLTLEWFFRKRYGTY